MDQNSLPSQLDYRPRFPENYRPGIGIIGFGAIARTAHLPAYQKYGQKVVGVYDINPAALEAAGDELKKYTSLEELLADPEIEVVDVCTHPVERVSIMKAALKAGKHVLAEKPLAPDVKSAREVADLADECGRILAVNQSGRWAPPWRAATLLIDQGYLGSPFAVTHLFDVNMAWWIPGTVFDKLKNYMLYDYAIHWIDITRCWLGSKKVCGVRAREYRTPTQPAHSIASYGMWLEIVYEDGSNAMIRAIGTAETKKGGHLFWVHGSEGNLRGSIQLGSDFLELERGDAFTRYHLEGAWYVDGFAGAMGELLCAIDEGRQPFNSARQNLLTLQLTFAACQSSDQDGAYVEVQEAQ